jgi:hypothetical protein
MGTVSYCSSEGIKAIVPEKINYKTAENREVGTTHNHQPFELGLHQRQHL